METIKEEFLKLKSSMKAPEHLQDFDPILIPVIDIDQEPALEIIQPTLVPVRRYVITSFINFTLNYNKIKFFSK